MSGAKDRIFWLVGTCLGLGLSPLAPGTCGALLGLLYYIAVALATPEALHGWLIGLGLVLSCWVTIGLAPWAETYFQTKDSKNFVTDEVAGFLLTVLLFRTDNVWMTVLWAFPVTRVIDVLKIPPARRLEHIPLGWGVVADDLLGSVYAAALLHAIYWKFPSFFA